MHFGEMKFKQRPREDQAESDGTAGIASTGAALIENNEAFAKLTTANGGTFT